MIRRISIRTAGLWIAWLASCIATGYGAVTGNMSLMIVGIVCAMVSGSVLAFWSGK